MSFRDAPPNAPRVAIRIENDVPCPDCGYNLRGLRMDGRCPECGRPTIDTFARPLRAATGVLAEEMVRRPGGLVPRLLVWSLLWSLSALAPPMLGNAIRMIGVATVAPLLIFSIASMSRLLKAARSRRSGSSTPLKSVASVWFALSCLALLLGLAHMGLALSWPGELEPVFWVGLMLAACASALVAQVLAGNAAVTVLRRLALAAPPAAAVPVMGVGLAMLIGAALAPLYGGLFISLRVMGAFAAAAIWLFAVYRIINCLREAQGSVVSIGRSVRR